MKHDIADEEYYALNRHSYSSVKYLLESQSLYQHYKDKPFKGNKYTELGHIVHAFLQKEHDRVKQIPVVYKTKKDGTDSVMADHVATQNAVAALRKQNPHILVATEEQFEIATELYESAWKTGILDYIESAEYETAYLFNVLNHKFKAKLDIEKPLEIIDIKTTSKGITAKQFAQTVDESHYDLQAALYLYAKADGNIAKLWDLKYSFLVCDTSENLYGKPREVRHYDVSKKTIERGFEKLYKCINNLNQKERNDQV